jgi:hypothetical protein
VPIRPESRWWILALVLVGGLLLLSAVALGRPDVTWAAGTPLCPHCRSAVPAYATRCPACREQFDWAVAPDEESPYDRACLTAIEAHHLSERVVALTRETAEQRVAAATGLAPRAAAAWLQGVGRGRCGWCGGTGRDLQGPEADTDCPACFGRGQCVACGGDRHVRVGDPEAGRAHRALWRDLLDLRGRRGTAEVQRDEVRRLARAFLARNAGTLEAAEVPFWAVWPSEGDALDGDRAGLRARWVADAARHRLDQALLALDAE